MVSEEILLQTYTGDEQDQFSSNDFSGGLSEGDGLGVPGGIVNHHQDVLMSVPRICEWTHQIHPYSLEGDPDDGLEDERRGSGLGWGGLLALKAPLEEVFHFGFHSWPVEVVPQFYEGVMGSQVAPDRI